MRQRPDAVYRSVPAWLILPRSARPPFPSTCRPTLQLRHCGDDQHRKCPRLRHSHYCDPRSPISQLVRKGNVVPIHGRVAQIHARQGAAKQGISIKKQGHYRFSIAKIKASVATLIIDGICPKDEPTLGERDSMRRRTVIGNLYKMSIVAQGRQISFHGKGYGRPLPRANEDTAKVVRAGELPHERDGIPADAEEANKI